MRELWLVWNGARNECVGFESEGDALYTATGDENYIGAGSIGTPALGDEFRSAYEGEKLTIQFVMIPKE